MTDILIENGYILTMDKNRVVLKNGAIAIEGNSIVDVGKTKDLRQKHSADRIIDATKKVVMPGLIDTHGHAHTLTKSIGQHLGGRWLKLNPWMHNRGTSEEFWYANGLLTALERLKFGVTCGVTFLNEADAVPIFAHRYAEGVEKVGIRDVIGAGSTNSTYPKNFSVWRDDERTDLAISFEDHLRAIEEVILKWNGAAQGKIRVRVIIPLYITAGKYETLTEKEMEIYVYQAKALRKLANIYNTGIVQDGHGNGSIEFAHRKLGILGPDVCSDDCTDLTPEDISIIKQTDMKVAHSSYALHSTLRTCPVVELIDSGVTVALATDGNGPDRTFDLFKDMKHAMHYHRKIHKNTWCMPPGKILEMTTIDAAKALLMDDKLGSLEPGKLADIIIIDMWKPHLVPFHMIPHRIANLVTGQDVDTVIVDGKILMERRNVQIIDENYVMMKAHEEAEKMIERSGVAPFMCIPEKFWGHTKW